MACISKTAYLLESPWPYHRRRTMLIDSSWTSWTWIWAIPVVCCLHTRASHRHVSSAYREGEGLRILDEREIQAMKKWDSMSLSDKIGDWSYRHQYSLIMGGWAGSLAIAGAVISRQKWASWADIRCMLCLFDHIRYQTYPQKVYCSFFISLLYCWLITHSRSFKLVCGPKDWRLVCLLWLELSHIRGELPIPKKTKTIIRGRMWLVP